MSENPKEVQEGHSDLELALKFLGAVEQGQAIVLIRIDKVIAEVMKELTERRRQRECHRNFYIYKGNFKGEPVSIEEIKKNPEAKYSHERYYHDNEHLWRPGKYWLEEIINPLDKRIAELEDLIRRLVEKTLKS